jgi:hypothetical protein
MSTALSIPESASAWSEADFTMDSEIQRDRRFQNQQPTLRSQAPSNTIEQPEKSVTAPVIQNPAEEPLEEHEEYGIVSKTYTENAISFGGAGALGRADL